MRILKFVPVYFSGYKFFLFMSPALILPILVLGTKLIQGRISHRIILPFGMLIFLFLQWYLLSISLLNEIGRLIPPLLLFAFAKNIRCKYETICEVVTFIVLIDTFYRIFIHPNIFFINPISLDIYSVKNTTSIFFFDSNLTALYALFVIFLTDNRKLKLILLACIYLAFSRAVYAMFLLFYLLQLLPLFSPRIRAGLALLLTPIFILTVDTVFEYISQDGSGKTKLLIMEKALLFCQKIFG